MMEDIDFLQNWLDIMAEATVEGDFPTFMSGVALPFTLITSAGPIVQATEEDVQSGFDSFHAMLVNLRATQMIRVAERVERISSHVMVGFYETQILRGGQRIFDPFRSAITLFRSGHVWKAAQISNGLENRTWPIDLPRVATDPIRRTDA